jgi:hypothetical protein
VLHAMHVRGRLALGRRSWSLSASCATDAPAAPCRLASSSAVVSSSKRRYSALAASGLAPNFQAFSRANTKSTLSIALDRAGLLCDHAGLQCELAGLVCEAIVALLQLLTLFVDVAQHPLRQHRDASGLRRSRSASTIAFRSSMERGRAAHCVVIGASAECPDERHSHVRDDGHPLKALPPQGEHQCVELRCVSVADAVHSRPGAADEAPLAQAPRRAPHAEAVVQEQLDAGAARVGEQVSVVPVRLRRTEYLHGAREPPVGVGAHVDASKPIGGIAVVLDAKLPFESSR